MLLWHTGSIEKGKCSGAGKSVSGIGREKERVPAHWVYPSAEGIR
jgi:hypothetical protein